MTLRKPYLGLCTKVEAEKLRNLLPGQIQARSQAVVHHRWEYPESGNAPSTTDWRVIILTSAEADSPEHENSLSCDFHG